MSRIDSPVSSGTFENDENLALARLEIEHKQFAGALGRLKALSEVPDPAPLALILLARLYGQMGLPARAQVWFERFLELAPQAIHERFELGVSLMEQGQVDAALRMWEQVLQHAPTYPPALYFSAVAHADEARTEQAQRALAILLQSTEGENLYRERGLVLDARLRGAPDELVPGVLASASRH